MRSILRAPEDGVGGGGGSGSETLLSAAGGAGNGSQAGGQGGGGDGGQMGGSQEAFWQGWISADGKLNKSRYAHLPDEFKPFKESLEKFDDLPGLLRTAMHDRSLVGKKGLQALPPHATDKDRAEFRDRLADVLGVPKKADEYGLKKPDNLPEEAWDADYVKGVQEIAHKHAISPQALAELSEFTNSRAVELMGQGEAARAKALEESTTALRQEWQGEFDRNIAAAQRAAKTFGVDVNDPTLGNHPGFIKAMARIASVIGDHHLITPEGNQNGGGQGPMDRVKSIESNPQDPLYAAARDPNNPGYMEAHKLIGQLIQQDIEAKRRRGAA